MTGSGKSEFLITYILSMAVSYSPDEVAFICQDQVYTKTSPNPRRAYKLIHKIWLLLF